MMREKVRLKIYQLDEVTLQRKDEYSYTEEDRSQLEDEIERRFHGEHILVAGKVYVLGVAKIEDDD